MNWFSRWFGGGVTKNADHETAGPGHGGTRTSQKVRHLLDEWTKSSLYLIGGIYDYNPDDLVLDKGVGVRIYQDMRRDPYVKAALNIKKFSVARLPSRILPASESVEDQEIARFVEWNLESMETSHDTFLWGLMDAVDVGYSIGEINFRILNRGPWSGKIGLKSIKSKDSYVYTFRINELGDIERVLQRITGTFQNVLGRGSIDSHEQDLNIFGQTEFSPEKFIICSFMPLYTNPYGNSDLRSAYRAFFIKDWAWKFRSIFMEKTGLPTVIGRFPNGTDEGRRKQLEEVLDSIQNDSVLTIPDDLKVEILRIAKEGSTTEYERAISDLNKEILIGILGSFLSVEEGRRTGARAQGEVHFTVSKLFIEHLARMTSECISRQLIRRLVDLNFPNVVRYPKFVFEISRAEELAREVEIDQKLIDMGISIDRTYLYEKYDRPTPPESRADRAIGRDAGLPPAAPSDPSTAPRDPGPEADPNRIEPDRLETLRENFAVLREDALPKKDPDKIGRLRDTYAWMFKAWEATSGRKNFSETQNKAYMMAGMERSYRHSSHQKWMDVDTAWRAFLKEAIRG